MTTWEFGQLKCIKHEPVELLPGTDGDDVSRFIGPTWVVTFSVRRSIRLFGRTLWTGQWKPMQKVAR